MAIEPQDTATSFIFDLNNVPASGVEIQDFDFSSGISSLDALSTMLNSSPDGEDQMALQRTHYRVAKPFSPAHLAPFAKARVGYSIEQLKLFPKMMVEQNSTPWLHPMLYDEHMPRPLQDALAACALYIARNDTNVEHVTRFITDRAEELTVTDLPTDSRDLLARAHALMLYQIMLVFSGDIQFYGQAEALLPHLEEVGTSLLSIAAQQSDTQQSLPFYPSSVARSAWKSYIFRESVRRTALSVFHFSTMCKLLRGQLTSCAHTLAYGNKVTVSAHLWHARTAFDFAVAWNDRKHFLVKELDFTELLRDAKPDDVDTFGRMMMIGLQGIDDIRGWFHSRGGVL
ncbi:hypothetical protein IQ07DRAFT_511121 [Pyrenochaeta sp. DS3sAY3a]|nr:hypothetical protein IQ07DRAFT_511121 [Pyrenochaeta sp. DS3sAY3a]